jgi:hypothetical protein
MDKYESRFKLTKNEGIKKFDKIMCCYTCGKIYWYSDGYKVSEWIPHYFYNEREEILVKTEGCYSLVGWVCSPNCFYLFCLRRT